MVLSGLQTPTETGCCKWVHPGKSDLETTRAATLGRARNCLMTAATVGLRRLLNVSALDPGGDCPQRRQKQRDDPQHCSPGVFALGAETTNPGRWWLVPCRDLDRGAVDPNRCGEWPALTFPRALFRPGRQLSAGVADGWFPAENPSGLLAQA